MLLHFHIRCCAVFIPDSFVNFLHRWYIVLMYLEFRVDTCLNNAPRKTISRRGTLHSEGRGNSCMNAFALSGVYHHMIVQTVSFWWSTSSKKEGRCKNRVLDCCQVLRAKFLCCSHTFEVILSLSTTKVRCLRVQLYWRLQKSWYLTLIMRHLPLVSSLELQISGLQKCKNYFLLKTITELKH